MARRVELWEGWYFYNNIIYDESGNSYTKNDILMSWQATELISENLSSKSNIKIMHTELKNRLRTTKELPTLCLIWGDSSNEVVEKVYKLAEL